MLLSNTYYIYTSLLFGKLAYPGLPVIYYCTRLLFFIKVGFKDYQLGSYRLLQYNLAFTLIMETYVWFNWLLTCECRANTQSSYLHGNVQVFWKSSRLSEAKMSNRYLKRRLANAIGCTFKDTTRLSLKNKRCSTLLMIDDLAKLDENYQKCRFRS